MEEITTMAQLARVPEPFGPRLKIARENAGYTQDDLARRLGVESVSIAAWERSERTPRANRLVMLSGILDVSMGWLLEGREDQHMSEQGMATIAGIRTELERLHAVLLDARLVVESAMARLEVVEKQMQHQDDWP